LKLQKLQNHVEVFINAGELGSGGIKTKTKMGVKREVLKKPIDTKKFQKKKTRYQELCKMMILILLVTQKNYFQTWMSFKMTRRLAENPWIAYLDESTKKTEFVGETM
jgi:hypothetical protein